MYERPDLPIPENKNPRVKNWLKAAYFDSPDWIPFSVNLLPATWMKQREALEDVVLAHPKAFPGFERGKTDFDALPAHPLYRLGRHTDSWGITWENIEPGMDSIPVGHPLQDWDDFEAWKATAPDANTTNDWGPQPDWEQLARHFEAVKESGGIAIGGVTHGSVYMRQYYLREFTNYMIDVATEDPRLDELAALICDYNLTTVKRYLDAGMELMFFADDLGMQDALPMSPLKWRKYVGDCYRQLIGECRARQCGTFMHSDGRIVEIIPDLVEYGLNIINAQYRANTLEGLVEVAKGRLCVHLDLDRQLFPFATPAELREHVRQCVKALNDPRGGLTLSLELGPDVTPENADALITALEEFGEPWM